MESSDRCKEWTSFRHHHHHHHHHHLIFCPLHSHYHHHHHYLNCHSCVNFTFVPLPPPQYSKPAGAVPLQNEFNLESDNTLSEDVTQMLQEQEHGGLDEAGEDDDKPIFVLTDEWREFFAASEAKRKLGEKKKAKKKQQK
ncbi:hypothetical protein ACOSQ2_003526 [Xanthoceras sorbifolium]